MLYLSVSLPAAPVPVTSRPRPGAAAPPGPERRRADGARSAAADPGAACPADGADRPGTRGSRPAARPGNRRIHDTRSEEGGTYRRKGQADGRAGGWANRAGERRPRDARIALAPARCLRRT